ncbi:MAG: DUF4268 domain-containing protein [Chitinophagaceae bacterium]
MYSKQEASVIRKNFWTSFGQYMKPVMNAEGEPVNWLNYKTGIKNLFFRMDADNRQASIAIEITGTDADERKNLFTHFEQLKNIFESSIGEDWLWQKNLTDEHGKSFCRISTTITNVNVFNNNDWPAIISFFKPRIIALDEFWLLVKDGFY